MSFEPQHNNTMQWMTVCVFVESTYHTHARLGGMSHKKTSAIIVDSILPVEVTSCGAFNR